MFSIDEWPVFIMNSKCYLGYLIYLLSFVTCVTCVDLDKCSIVVDSGICIADNRKLILGPPLIPNLALHLTFDELNPVDSSGFGNHPTGSLFPAPGFAGSGSSALFRQSYIYTTHFEALNSNDFSYTFYIYLLHDLKSLAASKKLNQFCPVIHKVAQLWLRVIWWKMQWKLLLLFWLIQG